MSFSGELKTELCKIKISGCCEYAELYGMFLLSRNFSNEDIFFSSDMKEISDKAARLVKSLYGFNPERIIYKGNYALKGNIINVGKIYADFITVQYVTDVIVCEKCFDSFMRGAFLTGGTITDPNKSFHAEIKTKFETVALSLEALFATKQLKSGLSKRGDYFVVYFKGNEKVSDFLALLGDSKKALEVIDVAMLNDMRNRVNRIKNCETANIGKTVNAAVKQNRAINKLMKTGAFENLSEELKQVALLRNQNPEMSLNELTKLCDLSRSGLNHRLNKIIEIAENLEGK